MIQIGARARNLPAPPRVVFESLSEPRRGGARPWLELLDDEVEPRVLTAEPDRLVVWSSLWTSRPDDEIHLALVPEDGGTRLGFTHLTPGPMPPEAETGHLRYRLNKLLYGDLRLSYGQ